METAETTGTATFLTATDALSPRDRRLGKLLLAPALRPRSFPEPDQLLGGQPRLLLRGSPELRQRREEPRVPAGALEHLRVHLRLAGPGHGPRQHPRPRLAQEVPGQAPR